MQQCCDCRTYFSIESDCPSEHFITNDHEQLECITCDYITSRRRDMVHHVRVHTGAKPLFCPIPECGWRTGLGQALKKHMRSVHGGAHKFWCTSCGFRSDYAVTFRGHTCSANSTMWEYDDFIRVFNEIVERKK